MRSQTLLILGASCASLFAGYIVGKSSSFSQETGATGTTAAASSQRSRDAISNNSSAQRSSSRSHSTSPRVVTDRSIHALKLKLSNSSMRGMDYGAMADAWHMLEGFSAAELESALKGIQGDSDTDQSSTTLKTMLLSRWAEIDGQSAVEFCLTEDKARAKMMSLRSSLQSWMKTDPAAAEAWYTANKSEFKGGWAGRNSVENMFFQERAKKDLSAALNSLDYNKTSERNKAVQTMRGLVRDPETRDTAITKVLSIEDTELQGKMLERMVQSLSYQDPDATLALVEKLSETHPDKFADYQRTMIRGMAAYDAEAALEYSITKISDENDRDRALQTAFPSLVSQDSEAAKTWLENNEVEDKDALISRASDNLRWRNPDQAMEWALLIDNDDKRTEKAIQVYKRWTREHKAGADAWLDQQDEDTRAAILEEE